MVDIVWESAQYKFIGRDLWQPLGSAFIMAARDGIPNKQINDDDFQALALNEIKAYIREVKKERKTR